VRPPDAFAARRELGALTWPRTVEPAALPPRSSRAPSERPGPLRLDTSAELGGARAVDRWAQRTVERVPFDAPTLARAGAFARAAHPCLQAVLRVDRELGELWLEVPRGKPLDRALAPAELENLRRALSALHGEGVVHGRVDRAHVMEHGGIPTLLFAAQAEPAATADTDFAQAARLALVRA
jgi:serine/threonine-protein kinase